MAKSNANDGDETMADNDAPEAVSPLDTALKAQRGPSRRDDRNDGGGGLRGRRGGGPIRGGGKIQRGRGASRRRHTPYELRRGDDDRDRRNNDDKGGGRRVFVGSLSWEVTWRELKDHMRSAGDVVRADVTTGPDGRSQGHGVVEYATTKEARRATNELHDTELDGRRIVVKEYRDHRGDDDQGDEYDERQSRRVYVGNLSWEADWRDLKDHMRSAGDVLYADVIMGPDGRSKGCGIVEFATAEEARGATENMTDTELKGRNIFVREDREGGRDGGGDGGRGGGRANNDSSGEGDSCTVFVGNMSYDTTWQHLKDHMRRAGNVDNANIITGDNGRSKGCALVAYQRPQEAKRALRELQNSELDGRSIYVREDREEGGGSTTSTGNASQLFVGNLSWDTKWQELKDYFRRCGDVERVEVAEGVDGRKKGFGTVRFRNAADARRAIRELNGTDLQGRTLEVRLDQKAN